ncbi:hypothetical protein [Rubrivirga sp. IMCC43871]|uniref:hypothetical protein n=1 Tax=Rubrivirga sp. IMCC43871 TaxID=3391575 RepID=UPI0039903787
MLASLWIALLLALAPSLAGLAPDPADLVGTWTVDLRPTPDAPAYLQPFVVATVDGDQLEGTFYGSPVTGSQVNADWDGVWFAFETEDGSSRYVTVGRLLDGVVTGTTYSPDRGLLQPWRAVRAD